MKRLAVLAVAAFAVLVAAPTASAASVYDLTVEQLTGESAQTEFSLSCWDLPEFASCAGKVEIFRHGRRVLETELVDGYGEDDWEGSLYDWSCNRAGLHTWRATVTTTTRAQWPYDQPDTVVTETEEGDFRVGSCTKWRARRVSRSSAAYAASGGEGGWGNEFVRSVRCSPRSAVVRGKASTWHCLVVHNNTYRECTSPLTMRFQKRLNFGETIRRERSSYGRDRCRDF